ncbi:MAG TPA: glycosyltransferase family 4 protein [Thermoanaerobaculia bacterium]|jgi:glycosyltransferase involved in cell wall biosynthesis
MKLLICTPTYTLHGGVERILEALARGLPPRGIEVVFALARGARFHDPDRFRAVFPPIASVDVDGTTGTAYGRQKALRRAIEAVDPDAVLIARMFDAYPVSSALKRSGHRLRLITTIQSYEPDYFADLRRYRAFVDLCVASGELIAAEAREIVPHVVSIPGGVAPASRRVAHGDGPLRLGYVGRLDAQQKRALDLIPFAAELERRGIAFTLDVAGDGPVLEPLREALPRARFHGWLSTGELYARVYPELDLLLHFAAWEGVTIAPREAMVHGVVPVVSRFPGIERERQMIDGESALTFPIGDVAAAADAVARLDRDRDLLAKLSANAMASQSGIRSYEGALDAWASALLAAVARPARVGEALPPVKRDSGLLTRLHVPDAIAERIRRVRRREHNEAGSEWPHWSGIRD